MAITDLTGYTWKPNNSVSITSAKTYNIIGNGVSQQGTFETTTFELIRRTQTNEFSGSQEYFVGLYLSGGMFSNFTVGVAYWCNSSSSSSYPSTARTADTEATLTFTGGTDIANAELIAWLEANGTLEKMVVPITQLAPFLTNIADAIRNKKGTTAPINAQDFANEIESIESGGSGLVGYSGGTFKSSGLSGFFAYCNVEDGKIYGYEFNSASNISIPHKVAYLCWKVTTPAVVGLRPTNADYATYYEGDFVNMTITGDNWVIELFED